MFKRFFQNEVVKIALGDRKKNLPKYLLMIFLNLLSAGSEGASFAFLFFALNAFSTQSYETLARWLPIEQLSMQQVFLFCILVTVLLQIFRSFIFFCNNIIFTKMTSNILWKLQKKIYSFLLSFNFDCINRHKFGKLLEIANSPAQFVNPVFESLNRSIAEIFSSIIILLIMMKISVKLTLITIFVAAFLVSLQKIMIRKLFKDSDKLSRHLGEVTQQASQMLQGIKIVHAYWKQNLMMEKLSVKIKEIVETLKKLYWFSSSNTPIGEMISISIVGIILLAGSHILEVNSPSQMPYLMIFVALAYRLSNRIQLCLSHLALLGLCKGKINRVHELLTPTDKEFFSNSGNNLEKFHKEITVENVNFTYPGTKRVVLHNLSLQIPKGKFIGIVGLSGSGKTTILDLLLRFYESFEGEIKIDGKNASTYSLESWRKQFGIITQEPLLFDDSISENISFGKKCTPLEIEQAAKLAGADPFIQKLPQKYNTIIGERGFKLSGGERQRIALARVFLRNPEIIVLDEATSNLDSSSEAFIQESLMNWKRNKTLIVVAHRLSTIAEADTIYFIQNGTVVENGTHRDLLSQDGKYALLWRKQSKQEVVGTENKEGALV